MKTKTFFLHYLVSSSSVHVTRRKRGFITSWIMVPQEMENRRCPSYTKGHQRLF